LPERLKPDNVITGVKAREILDSRGNPTVEADVTTRSSSGRASVPSGASTGSHEALELRDGDVKRFHGKGVTQAVSNVNFVIAPKLRGLGSGQQKKIDGLMLKLDGTPNKRRLGANAILAVSMAVARAAASSERRPLFTHLRARSRYRLPVPMMNVINGGEHAGNKLAIQEFHIEPVGAQTCSEAIRIGAEVYAALKGVLRTKYGAEATNVGDEGGFAPPLSKTRDALDAIVKARRSSGYGEADIRVGIDAAASTFYDSGKRSYRIDGEEMASDDLEDYYGSLHDEYGLLTIEDPFQEEAFDDFASITRRMGKAVRVIGDDLYVTNVSRIREGIRMKATNAVLIKLNQVGTLSETVGAIEAANEAGWQVVVSHRSGETDDDFIAHLATAFESAFIKTGAPARGERTAKYNELLRIEEDLGTRAGFAGRLFAK
jgi:enolase